MSGGYLSKILEVPRRSDFLHSQSATDEGGAGARYRRAASHLSAVPPFAIGDEDRRLLPEFRERGA